MTAKAIEADFAEDLAKWVEHGRQNGLLSLPPAIKTASYLERMGGEPSWLGKCILALGVGKLDMVPGFKPLPKIAPHRREQLWRIGYVAMYGEEVIFIRQKGEHVLPRGRVMPPHEKYPASENWGEDGFSYTSNSHSDPLAAAFARTIWLTFTRSLSLGK